jgi:hypothetical protein
MYISYILDSLILCTIAVLDLYKMEYVKPDVHRSLYSWYVFPEWFVPL